MSQVDRVLDRKTDVSGARQSSVSLTTYPPEATTAQDLALNIADNLGRTCKFAPLPQAVSRFPTYGEAEPLHPDFASAQQHPRPYTDPRPIRADPAT
jgi:hypothetical protein